MIHCLTRTVTRRRRRQVEPYTTRALQLRCHSSRRGSRRRIVWRVESCARIAERPHKRLREDGTAVIARVTAKPEHRSTVIACILERCHHLLMRQRPCSTRTHQFCMREGVGGRKTLGHTHAQEPCWLFRSCRPSCKNTRIGFRCVFRTSHGILCPPRMLTKDPAR